MAAFDSRGVFSYSICLTTPNSSKFETFLFQCLVPHLSRYPGPRSIVIFDNAPTHNVSNIKNIINSMGAIPIFLPAYSCDLNPIEMWFNSYKAFWRQHRHPKLTPTNIQTAVQSVNNSSNWKRTILHRYKPGKSDVQVLYQYNC